VKILDQIGMSQMKPKDQIPQFKVGDTVRVHFRIVEGEKERIQVFEGTVIARKGGESPQARFTVRRLAYNEGVERVFPLHSPRVEKVEVVREGRVRRAKLHYLRSRSGKAARVKARARSVKGLEGVEAAAVGQEAIEPAEVEHAEAVEAHTAEAAEAEAEAAEELGIPEREAKPEPAEAGKKKKKK
jgi:large subunit ribosomal protein L19